LGDRSYFAFDWLLYPRLLAATHRVAAELEDGPGQRVPWYEHNVRDCKRFEEITERRARDNTVPPQHLSYIRIFRLQAEAELLKVKAVAEESR
jgi:hypothetical protein